MIHRTFKTFSRNGVGAAIVGVEDDTDGKDASPTSKVYMYIGIATVLIFLWVVA